MAFTNDPALPRDRVRIKVGDTDECNEFVSDGWYDYYLNQFSGNENLTAIEIAKNILARFTSNTRERVDQVEIYGNEQFDNYLEWLNKFVTDPSFSGLKPPRPYAGGISQEDIDKNRCDEDQVGSQVQLGFTTDPYAGRDRNRNKFSREFPWRYSK